MCYGKNLMPDVRIDKWLWAARFFKQRSLAQEAVDGGRVHYDGQRAKSSRVIQAAPDTLMTSPGMRR